MDTLVLSQDYTPVRRINWQSAITLVLQGRVEVLEEYADRFIRSASRVFHVPAVVRLLKWAAGRLLARLRGVKFNRRNVWLRDKGRCQYCRKHVSMPDFTFDHVIPKSLGGTSRWENVVVACRRCNQDKRNRTPAQARLRLLTKPVRPSWLPIETFRLAPEGIPESWKDYLSSVDYWGGDLDAD